MMRKDHLLDAYCAENFGLPEDMRELTMWFDDFLSRSDVCEWGVEEDARLAPIFARRLELLFADLWSMACD